MSIFKRYRRLALLILLPTLCFNPGLAAATRGADHGILENIRLDRSENRLVVEIVFHIPISPRRFELTAPNRIVIDLEGIEENRAPRRLPVGDFGIREIRTGMYREDVGRVVIDCEGPIPDYRSEIGEAGLVIVFENAAAPDLHEKTPEPEIIPTAVSKAPPSEESEKKAALVRKLQEEILGVKAIAEAAAQKLDENRTRLEETVTLLQAMELERRHRSRRFVRIEVMANYYMPEEGEFKDTFANGLMEGAELNAGVMDMLEFWFAMRNFSKAAVGPEGSDRRVRLIPLEAGLKFRFAKGVLNPYIGGGAAWHQYKEIRSSLEIKEKKFGFVGQAGCFVKIAENLVFDAYAHYRSCSITVEGQELNIGGFHIGAGLGFEF